MNIAGMNVIKYKEGVIFVAWKDIAVEKIGLLEMVVMALLVEVTTMHAHWNQVSPMINPLIFKRYYF